MPDGRLGVIQCENVVLKDRVKDLEEKNARLETLEEAMSDIFHQMMNECQTCPVVIAKYGEFKQLRGKHGR